VSPRVADYSIASGIFNVKLEHSIERWERLIASTLDDLNATSRLGFAVNLLEPIQIQVPELYRTPPEPWIRYCEKLGSTKVLSGYGLGEFTLCVSKPIAAPAPALSRASADRSSRPTAQSTRWRG
jgi:hypothetical protein